MPTHNTPPDPTDRDIPEFFAPSKGAQELVPKRLIALYKLSNDQNTHQDHTYLEHAVVDPKGRVFSFAPMTHRQITNFGKSLLSNIPTDFHAKGWLSNRFLFIDVSGKNVCIVWKREPGIAGMSYSNKLQISNGSIDAPGMIFCSSGGDLSVWAYKEFKGRDTTLCHLPFHNVYDDGRICMGNSHTKFLAKDTFSSYCDRWEWLFFNTAGSEIHHPEGWDSNINTLHKNLRKGQRFPTEKLVTYQRLDKSIKQDY